MPEIEEKVLEFWKKNGVFKKSLEARKGGKPFRFFEGPPTANGRPHIGHVEGRAFKDVIPRYKTMQGYFVRRKAGWDTHGLPVEIEVEKELGLKNKQEIEKYGLAEFNEKAKASVWKYKDEWERITERIGFWVDMQDPYVTYDPHYVESVWWAFKQIAKKKLLHQSFKIVPWCPRCQTPLSSHEVSQGYKNVKDPSVYVKFKIKGKNEFLLVWTTTPWTLPSNVAIAINSKLTYTKYKIGDEYIWSYKVPALNGIVPETAGTISGKKMIGWEYEPLFKVSGPWLKHKKFFRVHPANFVGTEDGSGLVHIAPAFGEDDLDLVKSFEKKLVGNIPVTVDEAGIVAKGLPGGGRFVKQADKEIIEDLSTRGLLLQSGEVEHEYPFCWRCSTPLLYFARYSWFIEMSKKRQALIKANKEINWVPKHIKEGRFGEWLKDIKDWAVSRDRYWGTPLPIWRCEQCEATEVIGSLEDLDSRRYSQNNFWVLRHGEADHNAQGWAPGQEKGKWISHLTAKGKSQVEASARALKKMLGKKKLDYIITSPYQRARETADIVTKITGGTIEVENDFREFDSGTFLGHPIEELNKFFSSRSEKFTKTPPEGENLNSVKQRVFKAALTVNQKYEGKNILIISHGDPLWVLEGMLNGLSNDQMIDTKSNYIQVGEVRPLAVHNWPYNAKTGEVDLHRPYVDSLALACKKCKSKMKRVSEVADVWFDSGSMPFAQWHYPFENKALVDKGEQYPADYISEGIDQTRGWFYTMLAIATALGKKAPYKNVIVQGLILDKYGKKMSKSVGNVVAPADMIAKYGADALRWYFYSTTVPGEPKRFDEIDLGKTLRKFLMIIYNSYVFFETYGKKTADEKIPAHLTLLDQWIMARWHHALNQATAALDAYDVSTASRSIEDFTDDLSRWYIRRSRRRFQKPDDVQDWEIASAVLRHILIELSKVIAPFTPFFAEALYQSLVQGESVHMQDWPKLDKKSANEALVRKMEVVRTLASDVLAARATAGIKVRQPLARLEIKSGVLTEQDRELLNILKDEINVKTVTITSHTEPFILDTNITAELKEEGVIREYVRLVQGLRQDAGYVPKDSIAVYIQTDAEAEQALQKHQDMFKKEVGAQSVDFKRIDAFDAELNTEHEGRKMWIGVKKS